MPSRAQRERSDRRRALRLLADAPEGVTEALMLAHGFRVELLVDLCLARLATARPEHMRADRRTMEVVRIKDHRGGTAGAHRQRHTMIKKRRTYLPRIVGDTVMMPADLRRLQQVHAGDRTHRKHISDRMRAVVESEWPELTRKLPPKTPRG
jgi:hypothetical protein